MSSFDSGETSSLNGPKLTIDLSIVPLSPSGDFGPPANCAPADTRFSECDATVRINGVCFHVELIQVDHNGDAVNGSLQENVDAVTTLCGGRPDEMDIGGKMYVAVLFPHEA